MSFSYIVDRRRAPRVEIDAAYTILIINRGLRGTTSLHCKVINVSEHGALLTGCEAVPDDFYLALGEQPEQWIACCVLSRSADKVSVRFV